MPTYRTEKETYKQCVNKGCIIELEEIDFEKIKSMLNLADEDFLSANDLIIKKRWNSTYKLFYDVLHTLTEALMRINKLKPRNHQCMFAWLCATKPELELSWDFFELIRTKRNAINYYGEPVSKKDLKKIEIQLELYSKILTKEINKGLKH